MEKNRLKRSAPGSGGRAVGPLDFARNLEVKGAALYLKFAADAENPLARQLFYALAAEEIEHAKMIDEFRAALRPAARAPLPSVEQRLKSFVSRSRPADLRKNASDGVSYELVLEMEKSSIRAYTDFCNRTRAALEKQFFRRLLGAEQAHFDALLNVHRYLAGGRRRQEDGSRAWNWMV